MIQMPCPELLHLGLDRQVKIEYNLVIEEEDPRIDECTAQLKL